MTSGTSEASGASHLEARVARVLGDAYSARVAAVASWIALVQSWNRRMDLTAARSDDELCDLMLADAVALASSVAEGARVVDVGSGAGAPGLPLALLRADLRVTLVEPLQKRVSFLRTVKGALGSPLSQLEVVRGRGEDLVGKRAFDAAVARATLAPPDWLALGARLAPSGAVFVLLAKEPAPEHEGLFAAEDRRYAWPLTGPARRLVRYERGSGPPLLLSSRA